MEQKKTKCIATWWDGEVENPETEDIEVEVSFDDDAFFIEGLRQGVYLTLPLHAIAQAIADGTRPAKGLAR
ncbi:MAG TPA: hypothetical protein VLI94_03960 [Solirubrobacterales bacterium]|nr:hypothetical protein [Solirubrobacterales bacterium]